MAPKFLDWLGAPDALAWLDVGCGTGALSKAVVSHYSPTQMTSVDPSERFLQSTLDRLDGKGTCVIAGVEDMPFPDNSFDLVASGLALNFFPRTIDALLEMKRVTKKGGIISAYVWDYADKMEMLRYFWDSAVTLNIDAKPHDEGIRFPICNEIQLEDAFTGAGISQIMTTTLDIITRFENFDDFWNPFLGGQGPAPGYVEALSEPHRNKLKSTIKNSLPIEHDGAIHLTARAIAIKGLV
jgi:SAM-dependent methyltransferase